MFENRTFPKSLLERTIKIFQYFLLCYNLMEKYYVTISVINHFNKPNVLLSYNVLLYRNLIVIFLYI